MVSDEEKRRFQESVLYEDHPSEKLIERVSRTRVRLVLNKVLQHFGQNEEIEKLLSEYDKLDDVAAIARAMDLHLELARKSNPYLFSRISLDEAQLPLRPILGPKEKDK